MAIATNQDRPPTFALAIAGYGAALGSLFPIVAVMATADISGGLSVTADSAALVNTMQNIGAIVGLLIAPTFAFGIGRGRMMVTTGAGFLLASVGCALAPSLGWMLVARTLHGVFGGILPFLFMLLVMTSLKPGSQRFGWMVLFASSTSLFFGAAAAIGGGLVDHFGWRALFWAQAIAVAPYVAAASTVLRAERGKPGMIRSADWSTHITLSIGLSMILFALSEGERHFWIETWWVPALLVGGSCATAFALRNLKAAKSPLLK